MTGADPNFGDWIYRVRVETRGRVPRHLGPILLSKVWIMRALLWMWECLPLPSKLLVMKVKLYQIIEDNSAELHSMHSVNGSWFGPQKIEDDSAVFVCFYKIVPRLFRSCHETDTDEWRRGEAGLHFFWLYLETPGQNPLLGQGWNFKSDFKFALFQKSILPAERFSCLKHGAKIWRYGLILIHLVPSNMRRLAIHHNRVAEVFSQSLENFLRYNTSF